MVIRERRLQVDYLRQEEQGSIDVLPFSDPISYNILRLLSVRGQRLVITLRCFMNTSFLRAGKVHKIQYSRAVLVTLHLDRKTVHRMRPRTMMVHLGLSV
jgi:hypothetical protein